MRDDVDISSLTKKKRVNSRRKGNNFENKVCKILNTHFGTTDFQRTPGSGAFATTHTLPDHLRIYGDLITPFGFKFCIECKKGYNKFFLADLFKDKSDLTDFVAQAEKDAKKAGKSAIILWQQDNKDILVILKDNDEEKLSKLIDNPFLNFIKFKSYFIFKLQDLLSYSTRDFWFLSF